MIKEKLQAEHETAERQISLLKLRKLRRELMKRPMWNFIYRICWSVLKQAPLTAFQTCYGIAGLEDINDIIQIIQKNMLDTLEELSEHDGMTDSTREMYIYPKKMRKERKRRSKHA